MQVPATVEFVDIAGLVKGASKGEGLGNQFLANIRECDSIAQVCLTCTPSSLPSSPGDGTCAKHSQACTLCLAC